MDRKTSTKDSDLIASLGGPAKVAATLRSKGVKDASIQRVHNWISRGIPAQMKVDFPELFLPELAKTSRKKAEA